MYSARSLKCRKCAAVIATRSIIMSSVCVWTFQVQHLLFGVQQEDCFTNAVPGRRNCGRRSASWCGEQPVDRSQQTGDVGRRQLKLAGSTPGGILGPCRADTCTPELLSLRLCDWLINHHCVVLYNVYVFYVLTAPVWSQHVAPRCTLRNSHPGCCRGCRCRFRRPWSCRCWHWRLPVLVFVLAAVAAAAVFDPRV